MKYHPKHVEQLTDLNKLYSVASCWIIIAIRKVVLRRIVVAEMCRATSDERGHLPKNSLNRLNWSF